MFFRKIAFTENVTTDFSNGKEPASSRNTNPAVKTWATSIDSGQHGQQQLQSTHSNVSSPYNLGRSNQINSYRQDAQITSKMKVSGVSSGDPQFGLNEGNSKVSFDNKQTKGNFDLSKSSWKGTPPHLQQRSQFLTSTPASATSTETNTREMSLGQSATASRRQRENSFDIDEDLRDLLVLSDDEDDDLTGHVQQKQSDASSNRQNGTAEISSFRRTNASAPMLMQPTNHHHLSGGIGGLANLRSRADAQNKLLQDGNRGSPSSRNSWDSQK